MSDVIEGAEAWSSYPPGAATGVLVLHGLTGSPVSMRPLAERLAAEGLAVEMPLLPGHGTDWRDLQRTTWHDWAGAAGEALDHLSARTSARIAVGLSMGGTLALHLAVTRGADLAGVAVINPSLAIADPRMKALPLLKWVVPGLPGIGNDIAKPGGDEKPYPRLPLRALSSMVQLQRVVRQSLHRVTVPTLVLTSRQDHVVEPENSVTVLEGVSAADRRQVWLERSYHVATLDHDADLIVELVTAFARRVSAR